MKALLFAVLFAPAIALASPSNPGQPVLLTEDDDNITCPDLHSNQSYSCTASMDGEDDISVEMKIRSAGRMFSFLFMDQKRNLLADGNLHSGTSPFAGDSEDNKYTAQCRNGNQLIINEDAQCTSRFCSNLGGCKKSTYACRSYTKVTKAENGSIKIALEMKEKNREGKYEVDSRAKIECSNK